MKIRAAISDSQGGFSIETIDLHPPGLGEVLVKIKASGICHTDYDSMTWDRPLIMGHEGAGIVEQIGEGVSSVKPGDAVMLNWAIPCGTCYTCSDGRQHICEENSMVTGKGGGATTSAYVNDQVIGSSFHLGTMAQATVVKEAAVVKMTSVMPFSSAAIVGCGVMTGYGSAVNAAAVKAGSTCAVIGCGGVGLNVIQGCRISGALKIIAIDLSEDRLQEAKKFGATHVIKADKNDVDFVKVRQQVRALTEGRGADYAFECTAVPALGDAPLALIRNSGMAVQASGIEQKINFDCELFEWDKIYINPLYGQCKPQRDFPRLQELYKQGELLLDELVTCTYTLDELGQAFEDLLAGRNAKGVIIFDDEAPE
ncbi:Zn-dependent alcohol dehydrogenase [Lentisphaera profundi]|uniref:Zn-dependent alcohol dehydrogenase n=1 Tax=Lentisphaera profundi TaxID=1658616 RepID=A0ABY7VZ28_9BACT|nr:Zn-dependent alcohol dehydrogenase [Lentisphaera profundi]WDE98534.1 Zn-dependent alcohol dehydrogenase [Lentisphaera profundi]